MHRPRKTSLDSRRKSCALRTIEPSFHRIVGFETKNRHPLRLQARDRTQHFRADEAGKLPRRISNRGLRLEILAGLLGAHQMRRYGGGRPRGLVRNPMLARPCAAALLGSRDTIMTGTPA